MKRKNTASVLLIVAMCCAIALVAFVVATFLWPELVSRYRRLSWTILGVTAVLLIWRSLRKSRPIETAEALVSSHGTTHKHQRYERGGEGWVRSERSGTDAVVFVHGFTGHFHETWTWRPPRRRRLWCKDVTNLLDLLASETDLSCDYYSVGHSARNFDVAAVPDLANVLRTFLNNNVVANKHDVRRVILVSHSLGGVVCRQMILDQLDPSVVPRFQIIGLLMMGTPNLGTDVARIAHSRSARDIEPWQKYLEGLNREWL